MASHDLEARRFFDVDRDPKSLWDAVKRNFDEAKLDGHRLGRDLPRTIPGEVSKGFYAQHHLGSRAKFCVSNEYQVKQQDHKGSRNSVFSSIKIEEKLPTFDGSSRTMDFLDWFDTFEDYFEIVNPPDAVKCKLVASKLKGEAHLWWKELQNYRFSNGKNLITSWPRMSKLLIKKFLHTSRLTYFYKQENEDKMKRANCSTKVLIEPYISKQKQVEDQDEFRYLGSINIDTCKTPACKGMPSGALKHDTVIDGKETQVGEVNEETTNILELGNCEENSKDDGLDGGFVDEQSKGEVVETSTKCSTKVRFESHSSKQSPIQIDNFEVDQSLMGELQLKSSEDWRAPTVGSSTTKHGESAEKCDEDKPLQRKIVMPDTKESSSDDSNEEKDSKDGCSGENDQELVKLKLEHKVTPIKEATSKRVLELMNVSGITRELTMKSLNDWSTSMTKNSTITHYRMVELREYEELKDMKVIIHKSAPLVKAHTLGALVVGKSAIVVEAQPYLSKVDLRTGIPLSVVSEMLTVLLLGDYMVFYLSIDGITLLFDPGGRINLSHNWDFKNLSCSNILYSNGFVNSFENEVELMMPKGFYDEKDKKMVTPVISEKLNKSSSLVCNYVIENGISAWDASHKAFYVPEADGILIRKIQKLIKTNVDSQVDGFTCHIKDLEFVKETYTIRCSLFGHRTNKPLVLTSALLDSAVQPWNVEQRKLFYNLTGRRNIGYSFADSPNNIGHGSLIIVCWTREVHSLLLLYLSKVHVIPVTYLFDPGGILRSVRARGIGLRNGILAEHARNAQAFQRQCVWSSTMAVNNGLPCLCEPLDSLLVQVWIWYRLSKIHTKSPLISYDLRMLVQMEKLVAESTGKSFNSDDCGMQINEVPGYLISNLVALLVCSLPRYVDHAEDIQITDTRRRLPCSVVLFDEVKRAQHVGFTSLLPILDDDRLVWEWMGKKMGIGLSKMLLRVESDEGTMFIHVLTAPNRKEFNMTWRETEENYIFIHPAYSGIQKYSFNLTRGRVIPWEGWNDDKNANVEMKLVMVELSVVIIGSYVNTLCKNGQSRDSLKLFYKVVNGLDPPMDLDSACEASMWILTSSLVDELLRRRDGLM